MFEILALSDLPYQPKSPFTPSLAANVADVDAFILPANWRTTASNVQVFLTLENSWGTSVRHLGPLQRVISVTHVRSVQKRDIFC